VQSGVDFCRQNSVVQVRFLGLNCITCCRFKFACWAASGNSPFMVGLFIDTQFKRAWGVIYVVCLGLACPPYSGSKIIL